MKLNLSHLHQTALWASVLGMFAFIFHFGFSQSYTAQQFIDGFYFIVITLGLVSTFARFLNNPNPFKRKVWVFDLISVIYTVFVFFMYLFIGEAFTTDLILENPIWVVLAVILSFIRELSEVKINYSRAFLNPAQLFIISFLLIILFGTFMLKLPNATHNGLSYIDALFTATSAVCVTGLIVVDTGTYFTTFGQCIILFLIQVGGLGILTFASYFSYFFKGGSTYENQLSLSEMNNSQKIGDVFKTLKNIILITATIELGAAVCIFFTLDTTLISPFSERAFFSIFHAISSFCNAGFSTLHSSIYESGFRFNYGLQLILIITFGLGGLGFPIVVNILTYLKHTFLNLFSRGPKKKTYKPWVLKINSRINLITTLLLTTLGFFLFLILEYNNTLAEHTFFGKIVVALFGAATPRTAGFNSVDMTALAFPTLMITFLLMWIGASPASTGGGIKTSTFAIASLNIISLAKGKNRIEIYRREIADISVRRAFATISLSLIVIGLGVILITLFDPEKGLLNIAFESFSAYSTVGLSLGITASLSWVSKLIVIVIMFVGRVSMLSIMVALFKKVKHKNYRYPTEEITIN
ncbi:potassium transporter TrkG [Maribacter sp. X9]|uniref:potassium transporter TrkG n=1 Tax=Maribacter sp. X9 TaxID=3402159 RepID=UPI003AF34A42